jgi:flagellar L-ring protein precursor FlgH
VKPLYLVLLSTAAIVTSSVARADSIWARRSQRNGYLFDDNRARNVGDILTIVIHEASAVDQKEQRDLSKATDTKGTANYAGKTASDGASRSGSLAFNAENTSSRKFDGSAQFTSGRTFDDTMTVTVVDVLPNGNLVVEGHRTRVISGERRHLRITGVVRPSDLSPINTIPSGAVANFCIEYVGRGVDTSFTSQGYLGKFFNWIWPY